MKLQEVNYEIVPQTSCTYSSMLAYINQACDAKKKKQPTKTETPTSNTHLLLETKLMA